LGRRGLAPYLKKGATERAHIVLIDESGVLLSPLVRRSLAPRGSPLILRVPGGHRKKISVIGGLSLSPRARRLGLYFQTHRDRYITNIQTAAFLRDLLRHLRGRVIVVWDNGPTHKGDPIRRVLADYPRLRVEWLPTYAPDLNPVEQLWNHIKYGQLANFTTDDVEELDEVVMDLLCEAKYDPVRLHSFYNNTPLTFRNGTAVI
jgi:transposase